MRRSLPYLLLLVALLPALAGCNTQRSCGGNKDYLNAVDRPPLQLPPGLVASERVDPLKIPEASPTPMRLDPAPRCLDQPPPYFARPGAVADTSEEAVKAWALAWNQRDVDAVMAMYAEDFQSPGGGGPDAYLDQRREQVTAGRSPSPNLEDVQVSTVSANRRVVSFVQRFGDDGVRRELTLDFDGRHWRIVSERTLEVL